MTTIQPNKPYLLIDPDTTAQVVTTVAPHDSLFAIGRIKATDTEIPMCRKRPPTGRLWRLTEMVEYEILLGGEVTIVLMDCAIDRYLIPLEDDNLKKESSADKSVEKPKEVVLV